MSRRDSVAAEFGKPRFRPGDNVRSTGADRTLGIVRTVVPVGSEFAPTFEFIVEWLPTGRRTQVSGDVLLSRFTSQSRNFGPRVTERNEVPA